MVKGITKINPNIPIELGGKKRNLRLDLNAMVTYEEITGKNILADFQASGMGMKELRALLYGCLVHEDEELTLEQVGSWITTENMADIATQIAKAWEAAMPDAGESKKRPFVPSPGTG